MSKKARIMVVDDEKSMRDFLRIMLEKEGYEVGVFGDGGSAVERFRQEPADLVITDLRMQGMDGVELLKTLKGLNPDVVVIMITAYSSVDSAVEAMKFGAYDYFTKPFNIDEIKMHVRRGLKLRSLERENILLKKDLKSRYGTGNIVGASNCMAEIYRFITTIADTRANVLISGESGTGKELVARAIHDESPRREKPFVTVNCGAIPENLLESELFGHMKGSFTGAVANKTGLAEMADGGTLFLDEIAELPLNLQVKLLRFIQDRTVRRVGGNADIPVDLRLLAATNRDIERELANGTFREDLFYRLNVIRIHIPPLRDRKEDIPELAGYFVRNYAREHGKDITAISGRALDLLEGYDYPGNVRELENALERAVAIEPGNSVTPESLPPSIREHVRPGIRPTGARAGAPSGEAARPERADAGGLEIPSQGIDLEKTVSEYERTIIMEALRKAGGVKKKAAALLGISFRSMRYKLSKYEE